MKPSLPTDPDGVRLLNLLDTAAAEQRNLLATVERLFHEATAAEVAVAAGRCPRPWWRCR